MALERTLSIIKPDATARNQTGKINARLEEAGLRIVAQRRLRLSREQAEQFYAVHAQRPFFKDLCTFMCSGPVVVQVLEGENAIARNRELMLAATHRTLEEVLELPLEATFEVDCHHNYTELETHGGRRVWVTRKGAIRAGVDDWGFVPGVMGQRSFVVKGPGSAESYESSAHGAGRAMSRRQARRTLSVETFEPAMGNGAWQREFADRLLDEHPSAYKPIDVVMRDQADLVEIIHELRGIANYKGTS